MKNKFPILLSLLVAISACGENNSSTSKESQTSMNSQQPSPITSSTPINANEHDKLADTLFAEGLSGNRAKKWAEAESHYREAVSLEPNNAEYHYHLGNFLNFRDEFAHAEAEIREAIRLQPNKAEYHDELGTALFNQQKYAEAASEYKAAVQLMPDKAEYHYHLGDALLHQRKYKEAEAEAKESLRLKPSDEFSRDLLKRIESSKK